ncbi:hypothetical protein QEZ54_31505 [Catellatospora sp. KI3]|uniref:hypothetical protein n=1 Tax=Catellatospora sp. KI3 TaxID=3041620 RepID=UPI0024832BA1|nr:hypothetical protein [Catellatospora sp. KI3]MDI1465506.1 hypothetical protein [Catellatospora sp. KI3]
MRRLLGLLLFLWGCLLVVNTTFPLVAEVGGDPVTALSIVGRGCSAPLGKPPFAGIHRYCEATWSHDNQRHQGRLVGANVEQRIDSPTPAHVIPGMDGYAFLAPSGPAQVAGIAAPIIALVGLTLLFARRRRRRRGGHGGSHHDHDDDYDDDDSDGDSDGGDSGGSGGDGGGDGGGGD